MKMTAKQKKDLETVIHFMLPKHRKISISDEDIQMFFEWSDQGKHKDERYSVGGGFNALCEGKRWRGIHVQLYQEGALDGTMGLMELFAGESKTIWRDKWWKFWQPKKQRVFTPLPRSVVDFLKKEMFKGKMSEKIEECYRKSFVKNKQLELYEEPI